MEASRCWRLATRLELAGATSPLVVTFDIEIAHHYLWLVHGCFSCEIAFTLVVRWIYSDILMCIIDLNTPHSTFQPFPVIVATSMPS